MVRPTSSLRACRIGVTHALYPSMANLKAILILAFIATSATQSSADIGGFFHSLGDTFSSAGNTIKNGAQATFQVVKNGTVEAANVTGMTPPPVPSGL